MWTKHLEQGHAPSSEARLRARLLQAAVRDNEDTIADRLPAPLRPGRRWLRLWGRRAWVLALPLSVLAAFVTATDRSVAVPPAAVAPAVAQAAAVVEDAPGDVLAAAAGDTKPAPPDASLFSRPVAAGALALGVRRVVLDAGHGGENVGTRSASGLLEKDLTLDLAVRVRQLLIARGLEVVMTRTGDETLSLKDRAATANTGRGDIFVSIHLNSLAPASARGIETYYLGPSDRPEHDAIAAAENQHSGYSLADMRALLDSIYADVRREESKRLAESVQRALVRRLRALDPGIADRGVKTAPFIVLVATEMPAILAEVTCLSNAEDAKRLATDTYRQTIAEALTSGIQAFIDHTNAHPGERKNRSES